VVPPGLHNAKRPASPPQAVRCPAQAAAAGEPPLLALPPEAQGADGADAADGALYGRPAFGDLLRRRFLPVDLGFPGLRVRHLDPPVLTVERFFAPEECEETIRTATEAAVEGGTLVQLTSPTPHVHVFKHALPYWDCPKG